MSYQRDSIYMRRHHKWKHDAGHVKWVGSPLADALTRIIGFIHSGSTHIGNENYHRGQRGARVAKQIWPAVVYSFLQLHMDKFTKNI